MAIKRGNQGGWRALARNDSDYYDVLNKVVDAIFERACDWSWSLRDMAEESGLCCSTIRNLANYRTKRPQFRTVILLCRALDLEIGVVPTNYQRFRKAV